MNNSLLRWLLGYVNVHMQGMNQERFINMCANHGINLWNMTSDTEGIGFTMKASDFKRIRGFAGKSRIKLRVTGKIGLPFFVHSNRKRKLLFTGILISVFLIYIMSFFIWDISFEGNIRYTDEVLLKFLNNSGYHTLMFKKAVTCEDIESMLRLEYNDITWVSARIDGSRLVIAINENNVVNDAAIGISEPSDIVSEVDGVITNIITRNGTPMVAGGDEVVKGQTLVSGVLDIIDDSGTVVNRHFTVADSDIFARTVISYSDKVSVSGEERVYTGRKRQRYYLMVKDFSIESLNLKKQFELCDISNNQRQLVIGDSLYFPVRWGKICEEEYKINEYIYSEQEAAAILFERLSLYEQKLIKKGIQIADKNVKIGSSDESYIMSGEITVVMQVGESSPINTADYVIEKETPQGE